MAINYFRIKRGLNLDPQATSVSSKGDLAYNTSTDKFEGFNGAADPFVNEAKAATLTNKSIDASTNTLSNISNASLAAGAAIAYSKLALTNSIVNADIASAAAIAYSKLALTGSIVNADVAAGAAVAYSKLALTGSIVNADIAAGAAVAYSKLALTGSIVNADVAAGAAIAYSKLALTGAILNADLAGSIAYSKLTLTNSIVNADVASAAAIAYSKLALTGSLVNADVAAGAAIAYSKLNLTTSIVNADIAAAAAIARSKIAAGTANGVVTNDGSGNLTSVAPGSFGNALISDGTQWASTAIPPGTKNYITNPGAEADTSGWATYSNTAKNIPTDGTAGTATGLTFSRSTSSPLRGVGSFSLVQANSTSVQGKGVSAAFTIDSADQAKVLTVAFDYNASSTFVAGDSVTSPLFDGTTSTNAGNSDIEVFVYDVTNAVLLPVSPAQLVAKGSNNFLYTGTFQTSSNSTSYRLIFHAATTSANATGWTFKFDNVYVSAVASTIATAMTDWVSYTPTFNGLGTPTAVNMRWRRSGDSIDIQGTFTCGTVPAATAMRVSLPTGLTVDSAKTGSVSFIIPGMVNFPVSGGSNASEAATAFISGGTGSNISFTNFAYSANSHNLTEITADAALGAGNVVSFSAYGIPVSGWSSNVNLSPSASSGLVSAQYTNNGGQSLTGGTTDITWSTKVYDTFSAWNGSLFTAPSPGDYLVTGAWNSTAGINVDTAIYVNGVASYQFPGQGSADWHQFTFVVKVKAGDTISIRCLQNATLANTSTRHNISIEKVGTSAGLSVTSASVPTNSYWAGFTNNGAGWSNTGSSFGDGTNSGGNAITTRKSAGLTVTAGASNVAGVTWTPSSTSAVYLVTASFVGGNSTNSTEAQYQLTDGTTVVVTQSMQTPTSLTQLPVRLMGIFAPASAAAVTLKIQINAQGGNAGIFGQVTVPTIEWSVVQIT